MWNSRPKKKSSVRPSRFPKIDSTTSSWIQMTNPSPLPPSKSRTSSLDRNTSTSPISPHSSSNFTWTFATRLPLGWRSFAIKMGSIPSGLNSTYIFHKTVTTSWVPRKLARDLHPLSSYQGLATISKRKDHNTLVKWNRMSLAMFWTSLDQVLIPVTPSKGTSTLGSF